VAGQAEIGDAHPTVLSTEDVGRLDVAMHQAARVRRRQAARGLEVRRDHRLPGRIRGTAAPRVERLPVDELHGHEHVARVLADVVNLHHVGVRELAERTRLAHQALAGAPFALRGAEQLQRHAPIELRVVGREDLPHATAAEQREDQVAAHRSAATEGAGRRARRFTGRASRGGDEAPARRARLHVALDLGARRPEQ
jgi:hypothetical protein